MPAILVFNIYHYTLEPTPIPIWANCRILRQSPVLRRFHVLPDVVDHIESVLRRTSLSYKSDFIHDRQLHTWSPFAGETDDSVRPFRCLDILVHTIPLDRNLDSRPRALLNTPEE